MADNEPLFSLLVGQPNIEVNIKSVQEHTPLYYALLKYEAGDVDEDNYTSRLIRNNAQTNPVYSQKCNNLLQMLIHEGAQNGALYLSDHVQNLNHVNIEGETPLHTACSFKCNILCVKLLKLNANPNLLTNDLRQTPLHYAVLSNSIDCIQAFINYNNSLESGKLSPNTDSPRIAANFNIRDINGEMPLSLALNEGYNELVPILISGKADVNVRNGKDFTLLHQAILKEDSKTAVFLLDNGADMNAK